MTQMDAVTAWTDSLDALEEQVRRAESIAAGGDGELTTDVVTGPATPIPADLAMRARILLLRQEQALVAMRCRRQALTDEQRYLQR